jgi:hypothetical protein
VVEAEGAVVAVGLGGVGSDGDGCGGVVVALFEATCIGIGSEASGDSDRFGRSSTTMTALAVSATAMELARVTRRRIGGGGGFGGSAAKARSTAIRSITGLGHGLVAAGTWYAVWAARSAAFGRASGALARQCSTRAANSACPHQAAGRSRVDLLGKTRDPEVDQPGTIDGQYHVVGVEIAVCDPGLVYRLQMSRHDV